MEGSTPKLSRIYLAAIPKNIATVGGDTTTRTRMKGLSRAIHMEAGPIRTDRRKKCPVFVDLSKGAIHRASRLTSTRSSIFTRFITAHDFFSGTAWIPSRFPRALTKLLGWFRALSAERMKPEAAPAPDFPREPRLGKMEFDMTTILQPSEIRASGGSTGRLLRLGRQEHGHESRMARTTNTTADICLLSGF